MVLVVAGDLEPTSEIELHLALYRQFDPGAIVHTHAPAAIAVGLVADELPCIHYQMLLLGGSVRVAPYATFGTETLAGNVRDALSGRTAALMANHGAVTYGSSLEAALEATMLLGMGLRDISAGRRGRDPEIAECPPTR